MNHYDSFNTLETFDNSVVMDTQQSVKKTTVPRRNRKPISTKEKKR